MVNLRGLYVFFLLAFMPSLALAEMASLLGGSAFQNARTSLLHTTTPQSADADTGAAGSLYAGKGGLGLFAPHPKRDRVQQASLTTTMPRALGNAPHAHILNIISQAEAGSKGYDAIQHGARRLPSKQPTDMTISEIYQWIDRTPGQQHAIGRYQFIPATLRRLVKQNGVSRHERFSPRVQDILATALLQEAGLSAAQSGRMGRHTFMNNLARIWAGLPNSTGRSHYHGVAGNRATMSWADFDAEMRKVFPS